MKTKIETIAKEYGEHWEKVKDYVDQNGWIKTWDLIQIFGIVPKDGFEVKIKGKKKKHQDNLHRPKSLAGIENNRGWIKIESEADLPKDDDFKFNETFLVYYCCKGCSNMIFKGSIDKYTLKFRDITNKLEKEKVTHYQPIVKPEPPIY